MAARAYRELLKVQRMLFVGDTEARLAARLETRAKFLQHANAQPSEVPGLLEDAYNTAGFIHENVAQTTFNGEGNYGDTPPLGPPKAASADCRLWCGGSAQAAAAASVV